MAERRPALPFEDDERERANRFFGLLVAVLVHALAAAAIIAVKPIERVKQVWVEVAMVEPLPEEPPPPPELEPEPPPPEPERPKVVDFEQTVEQATPDAPVESAPADQPVRRIQGLSASSFAEGGSGFSVRAGTTLRTRATDETMDLDEAASSVAFSAVTRQPRVKSKPPLTVPDSVQSLRLEGLVQVLVDIDDEGRVVEVRLAQGLHPDADRACLDAWRGAAFAPAMQGDRPVGVRNAPYRCRIEILQ